ncbi:MAG: hypothetical protein PHI31_05650 [Desulfuromonadaceae bacterium]|nr:hypothetical protein [Desulfuromonadaceae bacterium]
MKTTEILISETIGIAREREFVRVGVPCAIGSFKSTEGLQLMSPADKAQPVQFTILKKWHDGSVKWLLLDFAATVPAHEQVEYHLANVNDHPPSLASHISILKNSDLWLVATGSAEFVIDAKVFRPFAQVLVNKQNVLASGGSSCLLSLVENDLTPVVESISTETEGSLRTIIRLEGHFGPNQNTPPRFVCRLHFFANSAHVQVELTLINPRAATHPGGLWDLGDSGSLLFKELSLQLHLAGPSGKGRIHCSHEPGLSSLQFTQASGMRIYQESSGGTNWNSPVHRTRDGDVHLRYSGYEITADGTRSAAGKRATPLVWCGDGETGVAAVMPYFWQEFPKAFSVNADGLKVELFPAPSSDLHELQGGEQKTTLLYLDFAASPDGLMWARSPLAAVPTPDTCRNSGVFGDLPPTPGESPHVDLVDEFLSVEELLSKREAVDEYGWRNFGELYADHEAVNHTGPQPFVSHYNNQYDGIGGLYRKFLATGNPHWGKLAADLARHVRDIDLYHTERDREEYNQGIHWHTDHYVDAGLSTHRSCSREHLKVKDPRFCGGGPGAEHCYSTGLLLHYFLNGDPAFRSAVINMAEWGQISLTGPRTVLAVIKKSIAYVKQLCALDPANRPMFPLYPFTRGTGNVITASLDAFEVSGDRKYLTWIEEVIQNTIHPNDDIDARNLLNAEAAWSYTVLLGAIAKYIEKKVSLAEFDGAFEYAKESFLTYTKWMSQHEYPYLDKPEILEYPNETWAAQDLRKSVIFHYAARYGGSQMRERYLERSRHFFETARLQLQQRPTSKLTRPIVLMLQNGWIGSELDSVKELPVTTTKVANITGKPTPRLTFGSVVSRIVFELIRAVKETSLQRERAWLRARM